MEAGQTDLLPTYLKSMKRITAILASLLLATSALCAQELTNFSFWGQKPVVSPEIQNDSVTFRLKADYATVVKLSGSWMPNPWGDTIDMKRGENNVCFFFNDTATTEIYTSIYSLSLHDASPPRRLSTDPLCVAFSSIRITG